MQGIKCCLFITFARMHNTEWSTQDIQLKHTVVAGPGVSANNVLEIIALTAVDLYENILESAVRINVHVGNSFKLFI